MRNRRIGRMFGLGIAVMALAGWSSQSRAEGLTTIASFNGANGISPEGGVTLDSQGNLYGTTSGIESGQGSVWEIASGTTTITTIASFNGANGASPWAGATLDSQGNLYGTTESGGASDNGTAWEITKGSGTITTLASFDGTNGSLVRGNVTFDANGNLYGTTQSGGANNGGTVWEIAKGTNTITTLGSFNYNASYGSQPIAGVTFDSHGNMFGTTTGGGGTGAVWEIAKGSGTITTVAAFTGANGSNPLGGVTIDAQGNLYGTTISGAGFNNKGTVWEIANGTNTITTLATFTGANGATPYDGVTLDSQGNLYGTTQSGGANNLGTLFEIVKGSDTITTLVSFDSSNGAGPDNTGGVTFDSQGNLYGTTSKGGASNDGTVFEYGTNAVPEPSTLFMGFISLAVMGGFTFASRRARSARPLRFI